MRLFGGKFVDLILDFLCVGGAGINAQIFLVVLRGVGLVVFFLIGLAEQSARLGIIVAQPDSVLEARNRRVNIALAHVKKPYFDVFLGIERVVIGLSRERRHC